VQLLLVEDDAMLGDALGSALRQHELQVDWVRDAAAARLALVEHGYAAVLLDLGLPDGSGMGVLGGMRARFDTTPVLIITARDQLSQRIQGLDAGADDYIVKPFQIDELVARLRAVVRRSQGAVVPALIWGDVMVEPARRAVSLAGQPVALSVNEYRTLLALMQRQGRALTREQLEDEVYGGHGTIESNTIAVYVHQLRRKLGENLIETVHGYGYRMPQGPRT